MRDTLVLAGFSGTVNSVDVQPKPGSSGYNEEKKKAKKVRRKPRPIKKSSDDKSENKAATGYDCCVLSSKMRIALAKPSAASVYIRKRSTRFRYIKIHTFITSTVPALFVSKISGLLLNQIAEIQTSLTALQVEEKQLRRSPRLKEKEAKRQALTKAAKQSKKKLVVDKKLQPLKGYISKEQAEEGLRNGRLVKGAIRINPRNSREAYVTNEDRNMQDYMILTMADRNGAMEADEVVLELKPQEEWKDGKATASVVHILRKVRRYKTF